MEEEQQFALDFIIKKIDLFQQENITNLLIKCVFIDNEFEITSSRINISEFKEGRSILINNLIKEKLNENNILMKIILDDKDIGTVDINWPENILQDLTNNNQAIHTGEYDVKDAENTKIGTIDICANIKVNVGSVNKISSTADNKSKGSELEPEDILFVIGDCCQTDKNVCDDFNNEFPMDLCGGVDCPAGIKSTDKYKVYNGGLYKNDCMIDICCNEACGMNDKSHSSPRKQSGCQCGKLQTKPKTANEICEISNKYPKPWDTIMGSRDNPETKKPRSCRSIFGSDAACSGPCCQKKEPCTGCCCCCMSAKPKLSCSAKQHTRTCPLLQADKAIKKNLCEGCGGLTISGVTCLTNAIKKMPYAKVTGPSCCCNVQSPVKKIPKPICCCCANTQQPAYKAECGAKKKICQTGESSPYNLCVMSNQCLRNQDDDEHNEHDEQDEQDITDVALNYSIRKCPICLTSMDWLPKSAACPRCCYRQPPIQVKSLKKKYDDELTADLILRKWSLERTNVLKKALSDEKQRRHICCKCKCKCCLKLAAEEENLRNLQNLQNQQNKAKALKEEYVPHLTETLNRLQQEFGGNSANDKENKYNNDNYRKDHLKDNNQKGIDNYNKKDRSDDDKKNKNKDKYGKNKKGYEKNSDNDRSSSKNRKKKLNGGGDRRSNSSDEDLNRKRGKKGKKGRKGNEIEEDRQRSGKNKNKNKKRSKRNGGYDSDSDDDVRNKKHRKHGKNKNRNRYDDDDDDDDDMTTVKAKKTTTTRKEFIYQMKKKNKKRYSYKFGKVHTGVVLGHKCCTVGLGLVPPNMGWRWNVRTLGIDKIRRGWRPGAVTKTIKELMTYFLGPCPCDTLPVTKPDQINKCGKIVEPEPIQKSTLRVQKANGEYTITMNPLKDAKELQKSCDPYLNCKPIKFKIIKDKTSSNNRCQVNDMLNNDILAKKCICNEVLRNCCCMNDNDKQYIVNQLSKISDSNPLFGDVNLGDIKLGELNNYNGSNRMGNSGKNGLDNYGGAGGRVTTGTGTGAGNGNRTGTANSTNTGTGTGNGNSNYKNGTNYNSNNKDGRKSADSGYGPDNNNNKLNNNNNNKLNNNKLLDNNKLDNNKQLDNKLLDKIKMKKIMASSTSESEMDIDFTPPAGLLKPKLKQKPDEIYRETQYDENDFKLKSPNDDLNNKNKNNKNNGNNNGGKNKSSPLPPKRKPK